MTSVSYQFPEEGQTGVSRSQRRLKKGVMSFASADLLDGCCERRPVGVRSREGKASSSLVIREDGSCRSATEMAAEDRKCLVVGVEIVSCEMYDVCMPWRSHGDNAQRNSNWFKISN